MRRQRSATDKTSQRRRSELYKDLLTNIADQAGKVLGEAIGRQAPEQRAE